MPVPFPSRKNIADLKASILNPALTSHFQCWFNPPAPVKAWIEERRSIGLGKGYNGKEDFFSLSCSEASLPGSSFATHTLTNDHPGITERHVYRRQYDTTSSFTFYVDNEYEVIHLFENWMSYIVNENQTNDIMKTINESKESIKNNSKMIIKIANRVDEVKEKIDTNSSKKSNDITIQIEELRDSIKSITNRTGDIGKDMTNLKKEIGGIISNPKISSLIGDGMKTFKSEIEEKISNISNMISKSDQLASEFHKKTDKVINQLQDVKGVTSKASDDNSKEVMAILKLNEYQSSIRMQSESKYGDMKDIEKMASQTTELINLFDRLSIETDDKIPLPYEVRQWSVGKIFDCADRWELRFSEVFSILIDFIVM